METEEERKNPTGMSDFISWVKSLFRGTAAVVEVSSWQIVQYMKALKARELEQLQERLD